MMGIKLHNKMHNNGSWIVSVQPEDYSIFKNRENVTWMKTVHIEISKQTNLIVIKSISFSTATIAEKRIPNKAKLTLKQVVCTLQAIFLIKSSKLLYISIDFYGRGGLS